MLLIDFSSWILVMILFLGYYVLFLGDNIVVLVLDFIESFEDLCFGDRVVSFGDGGVFFLGLLVG